MLDELSDGQRPWSESEYRFLLEELDLVLELYGETEKENFDAQEDWSRLMGRIREEESHFPFDMESNERGKTSNDIPYYSRRSVRMKKSPLFWVYRVAALFLVSSLTALFAYVSFSNQSSIDSEPAVFREVVLEKGQRANIVLSDGTKVNLNADTRVRLPEFFSADTREIYLEDGEAFFEVTRDEERPFIIHSKGAVIRVLGTSFTIKSYPEDESLRVVVRDGSVSLSADDGFSSQILLQKEQVGYYFFEERSLKAQHVEDMDLYLSWVDGYLKFTNTPMDEVARQLERRYDIDIQFEASELKDLRLTAELKSRSLDNVLRVITASLGISYSETDWKDVLFKRGNALQDNS